MKRLVSVLLALGVSIGIEQTVTAQQASPNSAHSLMAKPTFVQQAANPLPAARSRRVNPSDRSVHRLGATRLAAVTPRSAQNLCQVGNEDICLTVQGQPLIPNFNNTLRSPLFNRNGLSGGIMGQSPSYVFPVNVSQVLFPLDSGSAGYDGLASAIGLYLQYDLP